MILLRAAGPVAEQDFLPVVTHLRVAHAAARIGEQRGQFARAQVQAVELRALGVGFAVGVVGVVSEVGIPVTIGRVECARGENDLLDAAHRAVEKLREQAVRLRGGRSDDGSRCGAVRAASGEHKQAQQ